MSQPLAIAGAGAVTAVGFSAAATCAAIRGAISGFTVTGHRDRARGPTLQAEVPLRPRPNEARPFARLTALATIALRECVASSGIDPTRCALLLGVQGAVPR